ERPGAGGGDGGGRAGTGGGPAPVVEDGGARLEGGAGGLDAARVGGDGHAELASELADGRGETIGLLGGRHGVGEIGRGGASAHVQERRALVHHSLGGAEEVIGPRHHRARVEGPRPYIESAHHDRG